MKPIERSAKYCTMITFYLNLLGDVAESVGCCDTCCHSVVCMYICHTCFTHIQS